MVHVGGIACVVCSLAALLMFVVVVGKRLFCCMPVWQDSVPSRDRHTWRAHGGCDQRKSITADGPKVTGAW